MRITKRKGEAKLNKLLLPDHQEHGTPLWYERKSKMKICHGTLVGFTDRHLNFRDIKLCHYKGTLILIRRYCSACSDDAVRVIPAWAWRPLLFYYYCFLLIVLCYNLEEGSFKDVEIYQAGRD